MLRLQSIHRNGTTLRIKPKLIAVATATTAAITIAGAYYYRPHPDLESKNWGGPRHSPSKPVRDIDLRRAAFFSASPPTVCTCNREKVSQQDAVLPADSSDFDKIEITTETSGAISTKFPAANRDATSTKYQDKMPFPIQFVLKNGYVLSQYFVTLCINMVIDSGMSWYNSHEIVEDERYAHFLRVVDSLNPPSQVLPTNDIVNQYDQFSTTSNNKLLTISNHTSTIDDPVLPSLLLPYYIKYFQLKKLRWTLCSQEIGFCHPLLSATFGVGRVLPIRRGGGINQPLLHAFAQKLSTKGSWIHVFPEGKVMQSGTLGANYFGARTTERAEEIGRLKWGVGKIIAHCSDLKNLHVIPFHHTGMEGVVPQKVTGEVASLLPFGNNHITIRVGQRLLFDDLIHAHEKEHGLLYKVSPNELGNNGLTHACGDCSGWSKKSTESELQLYSMITKRIEEALLELERESKADPRESVQEVYRKLKYS